MSGDVPKVDFCRYENPNPWRLQPSTKDHHFSQSQSKQQPQPKKENHQASFYANTCFDLHPLRSLLEDFIGVNLAELLESNLPDQQVGHGILRISLTQRLANPDYGKGSLRLGVASWRRYGPSQHLSSTLEQLKVIDNQSIEKQCFILKSKRLKAIDPLIRLCGRGVLISRSC